MGKYCKVIFFCILLIGQAWAQDDLWQITFYCACPKCCGKWADGVTASGYKVDDGVVACNILPIGTIIHVEGFGYKVVMDRGAKKYFDSKKHIDIYVNDHEEAKRLGVLWRKVKIISMGPSNGGWDARVRRAHFVSDSNKKKGLRFRMGQGDFVLKIGQNGAKNVQFGALGIAHGSE